MTFFGFKNTSNPARRQAGFSLVELMVVVTIIGVLAGIAVPRFQTFRARSQQTEAKSGLNGIFLGFQAFQSNYNAYPANVTAAGVITPIAPVARSTNINQVGFAVGGNAARYQYSFTSSAGAWAAIASSNTPVLGRNFDFMRINTNKIVCSPFDGITNIPGIATGDAVQTQVSTLHCQQVVAAADATSNDTSTASRAPTLGTAATATRDCRLGLAAPCVNVP